MKIYLASSWRNTHQATVLAAPPVVSSCCSYCGERVVLTKDRGAIIEHVRTCEQNPMVGALRDARADRERAVTELAIARNELLTLRVGHGA